VPLPSTARWSKVALIVFRDILSLWDVDDFQSLEVSDLEIWQKINPAQFVREVRQEASKVTWPTRRETAVSTAMVFVFCMIAAIFFFLVDQVLQLGVQFLFGLGG